MLIYPARGVDVGFPPLWLSLAPSSYPRRLFDPFAWLLATVLSVFQGLCYLQRKARGVLAKLIVQCAPSLPSLSNLRQLDMLYILE